VIAPGWSNSGARNGARNESIVPMLSIKITYDGGVTDSRCDRHTILTAGAVPVFSGTACWSELVMSGRCLLRTCIEDAITRIARARADMSLPRFLSFRHSTTAAIRAAGISTGAAQCRRTRRTASSSLSLDQFPDAELPYVVERLGGGSRRNGGHQSRRRCSAPSLHCLSDTRARGTKVSHAVPVPGPRGGIDARALYSFNG
jgi:hypothetical protein